MANVNYVCSWLEHSTYFFNRITSLRQNDVLTDVTITCRDRQFQAHRLVLCVSSEYFRKILMNNKEKSSFIHIIGVDPIYIQNILQYVYTGQIEIAPGDVEPFLKVANELKICGLCKETVTTTKDFTGAKDKYWQGPAVNPPQQEFFRSSSSTPQPSASTEHLLANLGDLGAPMPNLMTAYMASADKSKLTGSAAADLLKKSEFFASGIQGISRPHSRSSNVEGGEEITVVPDMPDISGMDSFDTSRDDEGGEGEAGAQPNLEMNTDREEEAFPGFPPQLTGAAAGGFLSVKNNIAVDPASNSKRRGSGTEFDLTQEGKRSKLDVLSTTPTAINLDLSSTLTTPFNNTGITTPLSVSTTLSTPGGMLSNPLSDFDPMKPGWVPPTLDMVSSPCAVTPSLVPGLVTSPGNCTPHIPHIQMDTAPSGLQFIACKKGHSGLHCNHVIVSLNDSQKLHYNKKDYEDWLQASLELASKHMQQHQQQNQTIDQLT